MLFLTKIAIPDLACRWKKYKFLWVVWIYCKASILGLCLTINSSRANLWLMIPWMFHCNILMLRPMFIQYFYLFLSFFGKVFLKAPGVIKVFKFGIYYKADCKENFNFIILFWGGYNQTIINVLTIISSVIFSSMKIENRKKQYYHYWINRWLYCF